ncbi:DUF3164 family protein [Rhodobacter capsulatus]|uniref:DUF3164 family protein n=1 Tax=Rhodobacter capsulatus TaxID=1061 RepID=UPI00402770CD
MEDRMWINSEGHHVPDGLVSDADKMKDELVRRLHAKSDSVRDLMVALKAECFAEVQAARELLFEKYGAKIGGAKGNFSLTSFDGKLSIEVKVTDRISFGAELQAAKALIDEFIELNAADANDNIRALVEHAFQVNKAGRLDTGRILSLRKLQMKDRDGNPDAKWAAAMQAISDAVQVHGSATYLLFKEQDKRGALVTKTLDFAAL